MKNRLFLGLGTVISVLGLSQVSALAADSESGTETLGATLPLTWCIPFVCMLLCIAVCPLSPVSGGKSTNSGLLQAGLFYF